MTEREGPGHDDDRGQRPSGRGAVTERLARKERGGAHELDQTDDAAAGTARPEPAAAFDADERARREDLEPTGYEPPVADAGPGQPRGETVVTEPGEPRDQPTVIEPGAPRREPAVPQPDEARHEPSRAGPPGSLAGSLDAADVRNRFLDIQAGFVDEPRQAVEEAARFVDGLVQQVVDALQGQRAQLATPPAEGSTEDLRLALRAYRQFVDRLLGLAG